VFVCAINWWWWWS